MAKLKLTEKAVARLKAPTTSGKQELFWTLSSPDLGCWFLV